MGETTLTDDREPYERPALTGLGIHGLSPRHDVQAFIRGESVWLSLGGFSGGVSIHSPHGIDQADQLDYLESIADAQKAAVRLLRYRLAEDAA